MKVEEIADKMLGILAEEDKKSELTSKQLDDLFGIIAERWPEK